MVFKSAGSGVPSKRKRVGDWCATMRHAELAFRPLKQIGLLASKGRWPHQPELGQRLAPTRRSVFVHPFAKNFFTSKGFCFLST
jgi:hypothetical protein